ncbi:matrix metalloproteinase-19-like isoform X2 [Rhinatrema bivittatum]|uniref:matrix metalloproteinase-19-like isoform X2 n=1 Tax=Rhinatrema bivittatum TaxID=194408 RepID=UPI00112D4044|nr:matrix metalloproteinase-19-like isoform X2 [Rhinatrema bivittatum]
MEEHSLRMSAIILVLLLSFQLGSLRPIWKEGRERQSRFVSDENKPAPEMNVPSLLQPRGRNPGASTHISSDIFKMVVVWENVSLLQFKEVGINNTADIDIFFVAGLHSDGVINAFDGPGRVLGHAFFPPFKNVKKPIDGDLHLDNDENWTLNTKKGINLFQAAAHELGHSLGLDHSTQPKALMAPTYKGYDPKFQLHEDDIEAIQSVYGKPSMKLGNVSTALPIGQDLNTNKTAEDAKIPSSSGPGSIVPVEDPKGGLTKSVIGLCGKKPIDTFVSTQNGSIYVFKGQYFWKLNQSHKPLSPMKGYPQRISTQWKLPSSIDAAVRMQNPLGDQDGKIFFFKGSDYWKFDNDQMKPGYPKKIAEGFPGVPNDLDAAFTQPAIIAKNGKIIRGERIFFIKGDHYVLYDAATGNSTHSQSLQEQWAGVKVPLSAALSIRNEIFLVSQQHFQKVLLLSYIEENVFATVQQPKKLHQLLQCESMSTTY